MMMTRKVWLVFVQAVLFSCALNGQNLPYGSVIGGLNSESYAESFLKPNEQGIRISVIVTSGMAAAGSGVGGGGGVSQVKNLEIPADTDYLELLVHYVKLDPRTIRKKRLKIFRIQSTGSSPYKSAEIKRYWVYYNFDRPYSTGATFDLVQPGDIVVIENKGLLNREYFDFLADVRFLVSLPTIFLSGYLIVNLLR